MLASVVENGHTFEQCKELLRKSWFNLLFFLVRAAAEEVLMSCAGLDIKLDPGFKEFYTWCKSNDIPVIIVSRCVPEQSPSSLHTHAPSKPP